MKNREIYKKYLSVKDMEEVAELAGVATSTVYKLIRGTITRSKHQVKIELLLKGVAYKVLSRLAYETNAALDSVIEDLNSV